MEFFNYYTKFDNLYNVYKEVEFTDLSVDGCTEYIVSKDDNLMNISYKSYGTIDNWWCIYFFNKLTNILDFPSDEMIFTKIDEIENMLYNYSTLNESEQNYVFSLLLECRKAHCEDSDISDAVEQTNNMLENPDFEDVIQFKDYLYDMYIYENNHYKYLKIPSLENVRKMKQQMNKYNTVWSELNE